MPEATSATMHVRATRAAFAMAGLLSLPAIVPFGLHLLEHVVPLGITRFSSNRIVPPWVGMVVLDLGYHCVVMAWLSIGVGLSTAVLGNLGRLKSIGLVLLAVATYVSQRDITAILRSCWGEAPHFPWCIFSC